MDMDLVEKLDFEFIDISLIDLSSQNDFQFSENLTEDNSHDFLGDPSDEGRAGTDRAIEQFPILHETTEPEIIHRKGKYNLRKSLAWDSAFFTSAGVLDPEEVSTMLKGPEKSDKQLLPRIEEDVSGSNESISTFETDILTVDSLENDFFGDIRASIQRSNKKAFNSANSSTKIETMKTDSTSISSLQKDGLASETKNLKPTSKKNSGLQTIRLSKSQPKQNMLKLGSGKAVKQDGDHSQMAQSTVRNSESNLVPKPPKAISRSILDSTTVIKQDSLGRNRAKAECGRPKLGTANEQKAAQPHYILSGAQRPSPKPALPSKSSSLRSSTTSRMQSTRSHTSTEIYNNRSSNAPAKSSLAAVRRNPVKSNSSFSDPSSPIPKVPSRGSLRNKPSPSTLSAHVKSTQISSSVSPTSSISEWSSVSSSSSIINARASNSRTSLEADSCRSLSSDTIPLDSRNHSANQLANRQENHELGLHGNSPTKSSARVSALQVPVRPSGLRMPSPKIGYFDGVKPSICTPKRTMQSPSSLHTVIPQSGSAVFNSNRGSNIKLKSDKSSTARTVNAAVNIKPNSPQAIILTSFHTCVETGEKDFASWPLEGNDYKTGETCSEAPKQVVDAGAVVNENLVGLDNETGLNVNKNMKFGDVKIPLEGINPLGCIGWKVDDGGNVEQNHLENNTHLTCNADDKENHHDKVPGEILKGLIIDANPYIPSSMAEILREISDCASLLPETATEFAVPRSLFAPKNCLCDNELLDASKESASMVADKTVLLLPLIERNT